VLDPALFIDFGIGKGDRVWYSRKQVGTATPDEGYGTVMFQWLCLDAQAIKIATDRGGEVSCFPEMGDVITKIRGPVTKGRIPSEAAKELHAQSADRRGGPVVQESRLLRPPSDAASDTGGSSDPAHVEVQPEGND
jgi:hypothetical protein